MPETLKCLTGLSYLSGLFWALKDKYHLNPVDCGSVFLSDVLLRTPFNFTFEAAEQHTFILSSFLAFLNWFPARR